VCAGAGIGVLSAGGQQPAVNAELPGYLQYSAAQLRAYESTLRPRMNSYKQAAEQLGDFGNHTAWIAHREADGLAEIHQDWTDLVFVQSGAASLVLGGTIENAYTESPGELRGQRARGSTVRSIGTGDVVRIPAGMQHQFLVERGKQITFFTMKIANP